MVSVIGGPGDRDLQFTFSSGPGVAGYEINDQSVLRLAYPKSIVLTAKVRLFIDFLLERIGKGPVLGGGLAGRRAAALICLCVVPQQFLLACSNGAEIEVGFLAMARGGPCRRCGQSREGGRAT